jgi:hypothetical protein
MVIGVMLAMGVRRCQVQDGDGLLVVHGDVCRVVGGKCWL